MKRGESLEASILQKACELLAFGPSFVAFVNSLLCYVAFIPFLFGALLMLDVSGLKGEELFLNVAVCVDVEISEPH